MRETSGLIEVLRTDLVENVRAPVPLDERGCEACAVFANALKNARLGCAVACVNVATWYLWGIGVTQSLALSLAWAKGARILHVLP